MPRRVVRHLETGAPLVRESITENKRRGPTKVIAVAGIALALVGCLMLIFASRAARQSAITEADQTATASADAAQAMLPVETPTATPLALEDIDRPIEAGDDVRGYYPVILEIQPANAPARVFPVQQKEVEVAEWRYDLDPDVASAVLGLVIQPVLGIPYTPDNAAFLEALQPGDGITLRMSTGSTLQFTIARLIRVDRQDTTIFSQASPGLVITMLGDPAGDRLVIYGNYPASQEQVGATLPLAGDASAVDEMGQPVAHAEGAVTVTVLGAYTSAGPMGAELPAEWAYLLVDLYIRSASAIDTGAFQMEFVAPDGSRYAPVAVDGEIANLQPYAAQHLAAGEEVRATVGFLIPRSQSSGILALQVNPEVSAAHTRLAFSPPAALTAANLDVLILGMRAEGRPDQPGDLVVKVRLFNAFQQAITVRPGDVWAIFSPVVLDDLFPVGPVVQPIGADLPMTLNRGEAADIEFRFAWSGEPYVGLQVGGYQFVATLYPGEGR